MKRRSSHHHRKHTPSRGGGKRAPRSGGHTRAKGPSLPSVSRFKPFAPKPKSGWMRVGEYVKQYFKHLPKRYRGKVALSQSSLPDPKLFVHPASGYVSAVPRFPKKKLCGTIEPFFGGYHFVHGGKSYKAEKKVVIRDKRGRKRTVRRIYTARPKPEESVTVERTSVGIRNKFSPRIFMSPAVKRDMLREISKRFQIKSRGKRDTLELFVVLEVLFWMFTGN